MRRTTLAAVAVTLGALLPALFAGPAHGGFPGFTNGDIAFVRSGDIFTVDGDEAAVDVSALWVNNATTPAWSPDGKRIALASNGQIYVMNAGGGNVIQLTFNRAIDTDPAWSPDGTQIVFASNRDGDYEIYRMDDEFGAPATQLTDNSANDSHPTWGTAGRIAFENESDPGGDHELWTMNPNGGDATRVTDNDITDSEPNFSPDGSRIVYSSVVDELGNRDIYVADADGGNRLRLTLDAAADTEPAWSPDGQSIAFVSARRGSPRLFVMDTDGSAQTPVSDGAGAASPDWQPQPLVLKQHISHATVDRHGTFAIVTWDQTFAGTKGRVEFWLGAKDDPNSQIAKAQSLAVAVAQKHWEIKATGLTPGTTYNAYIVSGTGGNASELKIPGTVKTFRRDVLVTFQSVKVHEDSDPMGCGEFRFDFLVGGIEDTAGGGTETVCDDDNPFTDKDDTVWNAPDVTIKLTDVKDDGVLIKSLAVDNDVFEYWGAMQIEGTGGGGYGSTKDDGEWSEGTKTIDVSPTDYTVLGENYAKTGQTLYVADGPDGSPRVTWTFLYTVASVNA